MEVDWGLKKYIFIFFSEMLHFQGFGTPSLFSQNIFLSNDVYHTFLTYICSSAKTFFAQPPGSQPPANPQHTLSKKMKLFVDSFGEKWENVPTSVGASFDK